MALLKVTGLTKRFGGLAAVSNVDLHIDQGEILGLIGPNGAGKSTMVELLTGGISPTSGKIEYNNRDITPLTNYARCHVGIARTFQIPQPFDSSTVVQNVAVGAMFGTKGRHMSIEQATRRARHILDDVGLSEFADKSPRALTTAGLKRMEMARCLATDAKLMFLDEPLGGLNATEVKDSLDLIRRIRGNGVTILFIEHVIPAVLSLCDRVVVLANGKKIAEGTGKQVTENPDVRKAYLGDLSGTAARFAHRRKAKVA
ncbi:ABC transporter ATP-binding protein [Pusillimonas noertemannii]|uniref:ABC transporter ATP-binding protein n=1 Tax=Pusillimonas noertemannii TaxID=305977 RepID=UPI003341671C